MVALEDVDRKRLKADKTYLLKTVAARLNEVDRYHCGLIPKSRFDKALGELGLEPTSKAYKKVLEYCTVTDDDYVLYKKLLPRLYDTPPAKVTSGPVVYGPDDAASPKSSRIRTPKANRSELLKLCSRWERADVGHEQFKETLLELDIQPPPELDAFLAKHTGCRQLPLSKLLKMLNVTNSDLRESCSTQPGYQRSYKEDAQEAKHSGCSSPSRSKRTEDRGKRSQSCDDRGRSSRESRSDETERRQRRARSTAEQRDRDSDCSSPDTARRKKSSSSADLRPSDNRDRRRPKSSSASSSQLTLSSTTCSKKSLSAASSMTPRTLSSRSSSRTDKSIFGAVMKFDDLREEILQFLDGDADASKFKRRLESYGIPVIGELERLLQKHSAGNPVRFGELAKALHVALGEDREKMKMRLRQRKGEMNELWACDGEFDAPERVEVFTRSEEKLAVQQRIYNSRECGKALGMYASSDRQPPPPSRKQTPMDEVFGHEFGGRSGGYPGKQVVHRILDIGIADQGKTSSKSMKFTKRSRDRPYGTEEDVEPRGVNANPVVKSMETIS